MLMRTLRRAAVLIVAAAGLTAVSAAPANAYFDQYYLLINSYTNQCLEVNNTAAGTQLQQWPCHGGDNQRWVWKNFFTSGDPHLRNLASGRCAANAGGLILADCTYPTSLGQWFTQVGVGGGTGLWELRNVTWQHCFEAPDTYNGQRIVLAPCNGGPKQRWHMG